MGKRRGPGTENGSPILSFSVTFFILLKNALGRSSSVPFNTRKNEEDPHTYFAYVINDGNLHLNIYALFLNIFPSFYSFINPANLPLIGDTAR